MLCVSTIVQYPPNASYVVREVGQVKVSFLCRNFINGEITYSEWNIANFRGVKGLQSITSVLPDTLLEGQSTHGKDIFPYYQDKLTLSEFIADLHNTTLYCGTDAAGFKLAEFYLRVYCKYSITAITMI